MIISKKSWHYKLATMCNTIWKDQVTLCEYMKMIAQSILVIIIGVVIVSVLLFGIIMSEIDLVQWIWLIISTGSWVKPPLGAFMGLGFTIVFLCIVWPACKHHYGWTVPNPLKFTPFAVVIAEWIKGKANKFCPTIKIED